MDAYFEPSELVLDSLDLDLGFSENTSHSLIRCVNIRARAGHLDQRT